MSNKNIADAAVSEKTRNFSSIQIPEPCHWSVESAAKSLRLFGLLESASSLARHGLVALALCCAALVPLLASTNAIAAITDCEGLSVDGQAKCILPDYTPTQYWVCDIAGSYLYRDYAWQYCNTQMGIGSGPILSEETAVAYADCFDRRLVPTGGGVTGAVPWKPVGTYYYDNLCSSGAYVRALNGHELLGMGNKGGSSSNFLFTRRQTASCPAGYTAVTITQYGASDIYRCKPIPVCNPDQELRNGVCLTKVLVDKAAQCLTCDLKVGNPIYPLAGVKAEDISTGFGLKGIDLVLHYDTTRKLSAPAVGTLPTFGKLWSSSLHKNLVISTGAATILAHRGNGSMVTFVLKSGAYVPDADEMDSLVAVSGTYRYTDARNKRLEIYNSNGQLTSMELASGGSLNFTYSQSSSSTAPAAGYLMTVTDNTGRFLQFEYVLPPGTPDGYAATAGLISRVINSAGQIIATGYDANLNLVALTWPDTKTLQFLYENSALPWAMTGRLDESANRHATWSYDDQGRAIATSQALGVQAYTVTYAAPPQFAVVSETIDSTLKLLYQRFEAVPPIGVVVAGPNGQAATWKTATVLGKTYLAETSQASGSGSGASSSSLSYDAAGNVVSRDDFQDSRTCYAYDSNNRQILRVEGLAKTAVCSSVLASNAILPTGARKIATTWHPNWRLESKRRSPGSEFTTVYHGQPDPFTGAKANCSAAPNMASGQPLPLVCKQVTQATLDASAPVTDPSLIDPQFDAVTLMLRGDGPNGSTAFIDSGSLAKTVIANGAATISTAQSKFGGSSIFFNGSSNTFLTVPGAPATTFWQSDWTVEFWALPNNPNLSPGSVFGNRYSGYGGGHLYLSYSSGLLAGISFELYENGGIVGFGVGTGTAGFTAARAPVGTFDHVAVTKVGKTYTFFLNGVMLAPITRSVQPNNAALPQFYIGAAHDSWYSYLFNGYIDDFRMTTGVARYSSSFTLPTRTYLSKTALDTSVPTRTSSYTYDPAGRVLTSADANNQTTSYTYHGDTVFAGDPPVAYDPSFAQVSLLLHGNGVNGATTIVDDGPLHLSGTVTGATALSAAQSRFGTASIYFDGAATSYISYPAASTIVGSGDLTIEGWVHPTATSQGTVYSNYTTTAAGHTLVYVSNTQMIWYYTGGVTIATPANSVPSNQWTHFALVRNGTSCTIYLNGVASANTAACTNAIGTTATDLRVGNAHWSNLPFKGYLDDFRITVGKARYLSSFSPTTQEFPNQVLAPGADGIVFTTGDLLSITNPAGHVTRFTQYDKLGRVRQMIDPKGVVTDITYTSRGWVGTVTTTAPGSVGRTTSYTYDDVGQLISVSQPDGTSLGYSYDAAHRLVGVSDAKGNSVSYTLDTVGNRVAEEIKDPTGVLQRSINRSFDALNRLQQVTGAAR